MIGKEILNYTITSFIGMGGMGSVYLAEHKFIKTQKAAIKVINSNMVNDYTKKKLQEEAEHLARLNHTNIVHFIDYHIDSNSNLYLIMEYADGVSLDKYIETISGLIVEERICSLFDPILDAVGFAHRHGTIHRDIKPSNIIITEEGSPKILDFGIAKIIKEDNVEEPDKMIMGTPSYMSPEQVLGDHLDERSDIYSLGVLLHQMMTGNAPYDTTTLTEHDINKKVIEEPLPRMRSFYKYVSEKVQKVVDKATAKNPSDRFQNCEEFKKALHKAIYPTIIPMWAKICATACFLLVISLSVYWWDYSRTKIYYYHDYVEQWGVPVGIGEISSTDRAHIHRMYRMEYTHRRLVRLSHVNSKDAIITDGESERKDRPMDAFYFYNGDGKISRIKECDHNGNVLHIKSYNENLKTVIFQYDDQYGTEKSLGAQIIGYAHTFTDNSLRKGKISRWLLDYDANGYVNKIEYAGFQNVRVSDDDNIYGKKFKRDKKGRIIEESYLAIDGKPKATKWGLGKKKFTYDDNDNWIRAEYLTLDDEPSLDAADGVCVFDMTYDKYGNVAYAYNKNSDGSLMLPKMNGIAGVHNIYDDNGYICRQEFFDTDNDLSYCSSGYAYYEAKFDNRGFIKEIHLYDPEGNPAISIEGYSIKRSVNDIKGNELEGWFYNENNDLVLCNDQYAGIKATYDSLGNCLSLLYYGTDKELIPQTSGEVGWLAEYDEFCNPIKYTFVDEKMNPCFTKDNHVLSIVNTFDRRGNLTNRKFFNATGDTLVLSNEDIAGWNSEYDDNGNEVARSFIGTDGTIVNSNLGYASVKRTFDEFGHISSVRYFDINGNLAINIEEKCAGNNYQYDERGNLLSEEKIGRDEKRLPNYLISKYKYDSNDNRIEVAYFDGDIPADNSLGIHREVSVYNNRNLVIEVRYYNTYGSLTEYGSSKYAIMRNEYDNKGNLIKAYCYDANKEPVLCKDGWASSSYEYDALGHVTRQLFFGLDGKPSDPSIMVPEGICQYDRNGNLIYIAAKDGSGNFIENPQTGWSICRMEYDVLGNCTLESYFDKNDNPISPNNIGFHKVLKEYDKRSNILSTAYFDINNFPTAYNGFHKRVIVYDEQGRQLSEAIFDKNNKPTEGNFNFHKAIYTYVGDSHIASFVKLYSKDGQLVNTLRYNTNNGSWEAISSSPSTSSDNSAHSSSLKEYVDRISRELPKNLGKDTNYLTMHSIKLISSNSCEILLNTTESKYEMSDKILKSYIESTDSLAVLFKKSISSNCSVNVVLRDSKGRELARVLK